MHINGTLINVLTILIGGALGLVFGSRVPERLRQTVVAGLGLFVLGLGVQMFLKTENAMIVAGSMLIGGLLGEWWGVEEALRKLGQFLEKLFGGNGNGEIGALQAPSPINQVETGPAYPARPTTTRFVKGFLTASLLFAIGPMAILGSIQDGLTGNYQVLAIKAILDGFAALIFASTLGIGVLFSSLVILVYQGALSLLANQADAVISPSMMNELTATGGLMMMGIGISSLLEIKPIRIGNFLPALLVAPLIVAILALLK